MRGCQTCDGRVRAGGLVAVAVVLAATAGGVWFAYLRSTPEKTAYGIIAAFQADDEEALRGMLSEASQGKSLDFMFTVGGAALNATKPRFEVLEPTQTGDEAVVPVKFIVEKGAITVSPTANWVLVREKWVWKLDIDRTKQRTLDDLIHLIRG